MARGKVAQTFKEHDFNIGFQSKPNLYKISIRLASATEPNSSNIPCFLLHKNGIIQNVTLYISDILKI